MFDPSLDARGATAVAEQPATAGATRERPVVVTGASGFVGAHVCRALVNAGWKVRALARNPVKAAARLAHLPVEVRLGDIRSREFLATVLEGAGAVVHLAAVAIERPGNTYESANADATEIVVGSARTAGVTRFVHMSQNGSDSRSPYRFLRSKGVAQDAVAQSDRRWTILRPSVIFGPDDEFANVLARVARITPFVLPLPAHGRARFQPIAADDVAAVVVRTLDDDTTVGQTYALGGPAPLTLGQMAERILLAMHARRVVVGIPTGLVRPFVALAGRMLPHPPVTPALLDLLAVDNTVPVNAVTTVFGMRPTPFAPEELLYLRRITLRGAIRSLFA